MRWLLVTLTLHGCYLADDVDPVTADVRVALTDNPIHVAATAPFSYRVRVTNLGPGIAENATLALELPAGTSIVSAAGLGWSCSVIDTTVSCTASSLSADVDSVVNVSAHAPAVLGPFSLVAEVNATTLDPDPDNNTTTATSMIGSSGTFAAQVSYATGVEPVAVVTDDFNGDGRPDVATANNNHQGDNINNLGSTSVLLANSTGTLQTATDYAVGFGPQAIASGDFDGGARDLVTVNLAAGMGGNATIVFGNDNGTFTSAVPFAACCSPMHVTTGDLDGNGHLDLVVANYFSVQVILGNGTGSFANPVEYTLPGSPLSVAIGDMNNDGKLDVVASYSIYLQPNNIAVLLGNGNGTLQTALLYDTTKGTTRLALADFDGDGSLDVVTANVTTNDISFLRGAGDGTLMAPVHYPVGRTPTSIVVADMNGDAKPDIAVSNVDDNTIYVRLGNGDGTFRTFATYATQIGPVSLAAADVDGDGRPDLVVANAVSNTVSVLLALP